MTGRSRKAGLTGGDSCFADQSFAFVKVSFLLADVHDDPRLSGSAFVVPPARGSGARIEARGLAYGSGYSSQLQIISAASSVPAILSIRPLFTKRRILFNGRLRIQL